MKSPRNHLQVMLCVLLLQVVLVVMSGCGTNRNTAASRNWQAFTTRYNVYYNGKTHYDEQLKEMEGKYEDDYSQRVLIHPAEARADQKLPQPTGDFKRTIEKMQKSIQLHSIKKKPPKKKGTAKEKAFRARDEFNPFLHNSWMTMGKAQYMNGDFLGAAATFYYIAKHFTWLPATVTEARLWMALSYCALGWDYEAENAMHPVRQKDLTNKNLKTLYNLAQADFNLRTKRWKEAVPYLREAARHAHGSQKNRLWFLLGQTYSQIGNKREAYYAFKKAGSGASTNYRAKFNARIKRSEVFQGTNIKGEVRSLKSMTRYARNAEYLDQIYYAIGNLYMSRGDTAQALDNFSKAVEKSTRNGIDKALAQLALGNIYFQRGDYVKAQPCYSEAVPQLPETYPDYKMLKKRSDVLDELATYAGNVHLQDSLLTLSRMTLDEQRAACQKIVDELIAREKKEAEEAEREKYLAENEGKDNINRDDAPTPGFINNGDKSWYFYNTMTKNQGKTEFTRRWGSRKNEDDWNRRNKTSFSLDETVDETESEGEEQEGAGEGETEKSEEEKEAEKKADDPHNVEYYLKQIPSTPEEIQTANDVIQEGLYNMGIILKDKLEDFKASRHEFNTLLERYPDNIYRLDVYYNMYLMAVRQGDTAQAELWRQKILSDFPESPYGQAMTDPAYFDNLRKMHQIQEQKYQEAYNAYLGNSNARVHELTSEMERDYPLSKILPKFVFIDALSYLTEENSDKFKERISTLLTKWPDTDMTDMAGGIMRGLQAGRQLHSGMTNNRGMMWNMRLSNDSVPVNADGTPANFEKDPNSPQYLVLAFPRDSVNANQLLYDVARFNFSSFVIKDFDLEQMSFGNVGLLIVKGFANMRQLEHYRSVMAEKDLQLPPQVRPIMISKPNFELLLREGRSFEEYFRFKEQDAVESTEREALEAEVGSEPGEEDVPADEEEEETAPVETPSSETPVETPAEQPAAESAAEPEPVPATEPETVPETVPATE